MLNTHFAKSIFVYLPQNIQEIQAGSCAAGIKFTYLDRFYEITAGVECRQLVYNYQQVDRQAVEIFFDFETLRRDFPGLISNLQLTIGLSIKFKAQTQLYSSIREKFVAHIYGEGEGWPNGTNLTEQMLKDREGRLICSYSTPIKEILISGKVNSFVILNMTSLSQAQLYL